MLLTILVFLNQVSTYISPVISVRSRLLNIKQLNILIQRNKQVLLKSKYYILVT